MAKKDFVPKTQDAYVKWHDNLEATVTAATPGVTAADLAALEADHASLHAKMTTTTTADNNAKAAHSELNRVVTGSQSNVRQMVRRIKNSGGYSAALGEQLAIEGVEDSLDMTQQQPTLDATERAGGVVEVDFNKLSAEGVHLYSQRDGDAGFAFLASETHAPYIDNRPLLAAGKPETRKYKAVFFLGKAEIGLESDVAEATARP